MEVLNYVPSNVTMQIKALEDELGVRLFDRLGKQLALTTAGTRFLTHIQGILNQLDEARSLVLDDENLSGTLTISPTRFYALIGFPLSFNCFVRVIRECVLFFVPFPIILSFIEAAREVIGLEEHR